MIKSDFPGCGVCVDEHIFSAALHTVCIPEAMRVSDPMGWPRNVDDEIAHFDLKIVTTLVVGERALSVQRSSGGNGYKQLQYRTVTARHRRESPLVGASPGTEFIVR